MAENGAPVKLGLVISRNIARLRRMNTPAPQNPRCGHIALIGAPNAGKSTLINRLVGSKIAIVTPKAQTTRSRITGVAAHGPAQLIFLDVPGVFDAKQPFEKAMVASAWGSASAADVVLFMYDGRKKPTEETEQAVARVKQMGKPMLLALNKVDALTDKRVLLERIDWFKDRAPWHDVMLISALRGGGIEELKQALCELMPESVWLFPEDAMTDLPMRMIASELTREQCFLKLQEELPYTLTVETEQWNQRPDGSAEIHQLIIVQNERQKMIVIGKGGQMLKAIGEKARSEISKMLGAKCHLQLFVKVREDWKERPDAYHYMGLEFVQKQ